MKLGLVEPIGNANLSTVAHGAMDVVFFEKIPVGRANQVNGTHPYGLDLGAELFQAKWTHGPGANAVIDVAFECRRSLFFEVKGSK